LVSKVRVIIRTLRGIVSQRHHEPRRCPEQNRARWRCRSTRCCGGPWCLLGVFAGTICMKTCRRKPTARGAPQTSRHVATLDRAAAALDRSPGVNEISLKISLGSLLGGAAMQAANTLRSATPRPSAITASSGSIGAVGDAYAAAKTPKESRQLTPITSRDGV
jgi:hypothetical protein